MRKVIVILVSITLLLVAGYAGYRGYKVWKQSRLVSLAKGFIEKNDLKNAVLSLNQALRSNPRNVEANRLMAELSEAGRSPAALLWRSRVVALDPQSTDDRLALARTAIMLQDLGIATNALQGVTEEGKKTPGYHNIAGTVAAALNQLTNAETHFLEAYRLDPTNAVPLLNVSVVRLQSTNAQVLAEARTMLRQLCGNPVHRCQAMRELLGDAIRHNQTNDALAMSFDLVQQTNATFRDKIMRLNVLKATGHAGFNSTLDAFQQQAATNSATLYEMATWLMTAQGPADTLRWLLSLPLGTQTNQPAALQIAQCQIALKDWPNLQATLAKQNWAELELLRHAFLARAMRGQELVSSAKTEWELALKSANGAKEGLVMLWRIADVWSWATEGEELLWMIFNRYPSEKWAFQKLSQVLHSAGRTRPLMTLFSQELKRNPDNLMIKNNLALTAMLLEAYELKPFELAKEVYDKASTNSSFASTYAFSLHLNKKYSEALHIMDTIPAKDLEIPSIAGYYALILRANGNHEKARKYLDLATKATWLPEESKLIDKARPGA